MAAKSEAIRKAGRVTAPARSLREEQRLMSRTRILTAALELFVSAGYQSVSVDEIAVAAGMGRATFYLYFKSKKDIVAALVEENIPEFQDLYLRIPFGNDASDAVIESWINQVFDYYRRTRQHVLFYRQAQIMDPEIRAMTEANYAAVIDATWRQASALSMDPDSKAASQLRMRMRLFIGLIDSTCYMAAVQGLVDPATSRAELVHLWRCFWNR